MAMPAKTAADAVAADVISKAECARRLGLTRGQISQLTAPGQSLAEAMTAEGRIRWRLASALLRARADGAKTRLPPSPSPQAWSPPLAAAEENEPEPEPAAVYPLTEEDRAFKRARARKMEADADGAEAARLERLGALINRQAAEAEMLSHARGLRDRLLAIPARVADELVGKTDAREIRALLMARLRGALAEFAAAMTRELEDEAG